MTQWYTNKTDTKENCGKCLYWCNIKECPTEQKYRAEGKVVPKSHESCSKFHKFKGQFI